MKKLLLVLFLLLFIPTTRATTIEAGISIDYVPKALYGTWRVNAKLDTTNSPRSFRPQSIDLWNLTRIENTIKLDNPFSGANAEISVQTVEGNLIVFSKRLPYNNNKVLTDTVTIRLDKDKFLGINTLCLESYSLLDNHLIKTETATYHINGEKISGNNILEE